MIWPAKDSVRLIREHGRPLYETPEGKFPRVTHVLRYLDLPSENGARKSENLIRWAAGKGKEHQQILVEAGDFGTAVHDQLKRHFLGEPLGPLEGLALSAYEQALRWWETNDLQVEAVEQPIWNTLEGYAGRLDLVASRPGGDLWVVDFKTSAGIYLEHHVQAASYCRAVERHTLTRTRGLIVRLPKVAGGTLETQELGRTHQGLYTETELETLMAAALLIERTVAGKNGKR